MKTARTRLCWNKSKDRCCCNRRPMECSRSSRQGFRGVTACRRDIER